MCDLFFKLEEGIPYVPTLNMTPKDDACIQALMAVTLSPLMDWYPCSFLISAEQAAFQTSSW